MFKTCGEDVGLPCKGHTVIITGASRGIGAEVAKLLAAAGANVVLAARNKENLERVAGEIRSKKGSCLVVPTDVCQQDSLKQCFDATIRHFGPITALVNNAAVGYPTSLETVTEEDMQHMFKCVVGMTQATQMALEHFNLRLRTCTPSAESEGAASTYEGIPPGRGVRGEMGDMMEAGAYEDPTRTHTHTLPESAPRRRLPQASAESDIQTTTHTHAHIPASGMWVINFSSVAGTPNHWFHAGSDMYAYDVSKGGVDVLTLATAGMFEKKEPYAMRYPADSDNPVCKCVAVCPFAFDTDMFRHTAETWGKSPVEAAKLCNPSGLLGDPRLVGELLSDMLGGRAVLWRNGDVKLIDGDGSITSVQRLHVLGPDSAEPLPQTDDSCGCDP